MTVKELLKQLKDAKEDAEVWIQAVEEPIGDFIKISEIEIDIQDGDIYLKA